MSDALSKARAALANVTPGPWGAADGGSFGGWWISLNGDPSNVTIAAVPLKLADAEFIAMARNIFPAMLDVIEAADVACRQTSTKGAYLALNDVEAALARFYDANGDEDELG